MAGHEDTGSKANSEPGSEPVTPFGTPPPLHREPPLIEGQAVHTPDAEPLHTAASESGMPPHVAGLATPRPPSHHRLSPIAILAVALIGAATGFASAYVARLFLDDTQKNFASLDQRLTSLNSKLTADEKKIDMAGSGSRDALSALEKRLGTVEKSARDALGLAMAVQTEAQKASSAGTPAASASNAPDLAPVQSRIDKLEQRLNQLEAALNAPKTAVRAPQEREAKQDPLVANAPALAIVAENLVQKIASGVPFATEIAALDKLGADKAKLAALQPAAAKGLETTRTLSEQFTALAPALLASEKPGSQAQESVFARLMNHAANLVRIRRVGDLSGEDLSARIARVQDALAHDDTDRALQEWASFPEAAKAASANWAEAAKARASTLATAKAIAADAMANLAKVKS